MSQPHDDKPTPSSISTPTGGGDVGVASHQNGPHPSRAASKSNRIWFDTEFIENGSTVDLISIGMVREDGASYYAEIEECDLSKASEWVKQNVIRHLNVTPFPRARVAQEIVAFVGEKPEFWAYYADYDWVALCQLFGTMMDLPKGWPMYCRDVKQLCDALGNPKLPPQETQEHHALSDAVWTKGAWQFLQDEMGAAVHTDATSSPSTDRERKYREALEAWQAFDNEPTHREAEGHELITRARILTRSALPTEQDKCVDASLNDGHVKAVVEARMLILEDGRAVCVGGRWDGWLFRRHPDGQWVSVAKLSEEAPTYEGIFT